MDFDELWRKIWEVKPNKEETKNDAPDNAVTDPTPTEESWLYRFWQESPRAVLRMIALKFIELIKNCQSGSPIQSIGDLD
ncbi:hypothetical protein Pmar_PMAR026456 [Perkinsus marinus ATCC 50983]|uniref:Uncharacterized protein n=1 Tax=Perkinsus marinus (strain ATCC 50983 / TXsc) TaxID=423536 RepID=C5L5M6_PERM5|nr:hypothetical protein Pmar_PMAR026456 [Perkinsus marinus ATCC 50983]EER07960.1 hypothetical protein Pmar_PMAR026456 [Perkinsus marinus ATCC 50983]|eukprot:XP_002776144.1 hypothetical protein Pmar_PMAR026456 [Perkinsus marinus ATCC 50983]